MNKIYFIISLVVIAILITVIFVLNSNKCEFNSTELEEFGRIKEFWVTNGEHICDMKQEFLDFYCMGY